MKKFVKSTINFSKIFKCIQEYKKSIMTRRLQILTMLTLLFIYLPIKKMRAQTSVDSLELKIERLETEINSFRDSISIRKSKINALKDSIEQSKVSNSSTYWLKDFEQNIYVSKHTESRVLKTVHAGAQITVLDSTDNFYEVEYKTGYMGYSGSSKTGFLPIKSGMFSEQIVPKISPLDIAKRNKANKLKRYENLPEKAKKAILNGEVYIGMKRSWVIESIGYPDDINKTTTQYSVREQFIYEELNGERKYLYIEDGILTTIQE